MRFATQIDDSFYEKKKPKQKKNDILNCLKKYGLLKLLLIILQRNYMILPHL